jgi:hypothetical protein
MFPASLTVPQNAVRGVLGVTIVVLLVMGYSDETFAASCKMSAAQIAAVAALPTRPVTQNAQGAFVRDGKVMSDVLVQDMCKTRRMYDRVIAREAAGKTLTLEEIADGYIPNLLTQSELERLKRHTGRVLYQ